MRQVTSQSRIHIGAVLVGMLSKLVVETRLRTIPVAQSLLCYHIYGTDTNSKHTFPIIKKIK